MQIEQNIVSFSTSVTGERGYIDIARCLTAVNGKYITQTKRRDGKYIPLNYMIKVRALTGDVAVSTLSAGYPTRNSVVLAGAARDAMLKSAGIPRSNLETYQKELRLIMETGAGRLHQYMPGCVGKGDPSSNQAWGVDLYEITNLVLADPDGTPDGMSKKLAMLGTQASSASDWDDDDDFFVIDNWRKFRKELTPQSALDDTENNVFSWAMQQSDTAGDIIDLIDDTMDNKPYDLNNFTSKMIDTVVGTNVGNPSSAVISAPLGLLKITTGSSGPFGWEIEVVGVTEL